MTFQYFGELAALGTALCWTFGSQFFEAAGKRIGARSVNMLRLIMAFLFFCITSLIMHGNLIPLDYPAKAWIWLSISGFVGFALGDLFLFSAFVEIGPRLSMLIMSLTAPVSAILGWVFLGEHYEPHHWLAMLVTLSGVSWVILERAGQITGANSGKRKIRQITGHGVLMAFLGTLGQATGYIMSKYGMQNAGSYLEPFASTQIRVIAGLLGFVVILSFKKGWPDLIQSLKNKDAMVFMSGGAFMGPFLGVSLSLLALHYTTAGVAATITALVPIFLIPSVILIAKEHVSLRAFMGAIVAVAGVFILMIK